MPDNPLSTEARSNEAFNEQQAREEFGGAFIDELKLKQRDWDFKGDWWQLAFLRKCCDRRQKGADEWNEWRAESAKFIHLEHAVLDETHLEKFRLHSAHLEGARLNTAHLEGANLRWAQLTDTSLAGAYLNGAELYAVTMFGTNLSRADLRKADLRHARCVRAHFENACMNGARFGFARLVDCHFAAASMKRTKGLYGPGKAIVSGGDLDMLSADAEQVKFSHWRFACWFRWASIRKFGSLPILGASYTALIAIVVALGGYRWYNNGIAALQVQLASQPAAPQWASRLPELEVPERFGYLILSIVALAIASTLFKFRCPEIVQEYSETNWNRELQKHLIEYRAADYCDAVGRTVCISLYVLGGGYALGYLCRHIWKALMYAWAAAM